LRNKQKTEKKKEMKREKSEREGEKIVIEKILLDFLTEKCRCLLGLLDAIHFS